MRISKCTLPPITTLFPLNIEGITIPNIKEHIDNEQKLISTIKSKFTPEEDDFLMRLVLMHKNPNWNEIAAMMRTRNARQCRERWKNYLNPDLRLDPWTFEEDQLLIQKYSEFGSHWNKISKFFINRSDNSIRNRWQMLVRHWEKHHEYLSPPHISDNS